jgi:hypothetical protein
MHQHNDVEYRERPTVVEHHDDGGAWVGMLFALVVIVGLLVALFVWSPWAGTNADTTAPNDTNIDIRGDFTVPVQGSGSGGAEIPSGSGTDMGGGQ